MRRRIAIDGRVMQDAYHGIGRHTYELLRRLATRDVDLVIVRDPTRRGRLDVDALAGPHVELVDLPIPVVSPLAQPRWPRLLAGVAPDVLLVPYHLATPWVHPGVPTVSFVHDCIFETDPAFAPGGRRFLAAYRLATRLAIARSTRLATVSEATRQDLLLRYGQSLPAHAVVPQGVGDQFRALPRRSGRYVLHVGAQRPHKNHRVLIAAFAEVAAALPDVHLVLVGQRDPRFPGCVASLIRELDSTGRIRLLEQVGDEELLRLYAGAAVFAFPSRAEGFGLPVLEAMAAGVPTVTSDAPAVVEAGAGASLVAAAEDPHAWAEALIRVLTAPEVAADLAARGRAVAAEHTWDRAAERTLQLVEAVCHDFPRRARLSPRGGPS
ncbi:glycosyltransferase family 1 protein [Actinoplanes sp. TFC3]|uniref:glycosyltransferase family 4 protein n=1 Tax=Actinoplanes sp. TFC3 TaxID=1710355 RepID=UPI000833A721|nr:glycosyltransferase family 1 protein [Actinoplanes sp. TFC3]